MHVTSWLQVQRLGKDWLLVSACYVVPPGRGTVAKGNMWRALTHLSLNLAWTSSFTLVFGHRQTMLPANEERDPLLSPTPEIEDPSENEFPFQELDLADFCVQVRNEDRQPRKKSRGLAAACITNRSTHSLQETTSQGISSPSLEYRRRKAGAEGPNLKPLQIFQQSYFSWYRLPLRRWISLMAL